MCHLLLVNDDEKWLLRPFCFWNTSPAFLLLFFTNELGYIIGGLFLLGASKWQQKQRG
jgi:hypothetical protein